MRFAVRVLACVGAGAVSLALADPVTPAPAPTAAAPSASTTPSAPTSAAATPAPATAAAATPQAAAAVTPALDPEEKRLLAQGYRMQMRHGDKVFCRREDVTGSRLAEKLTCGTAAQLKAAQALTREAVERAQRTPANKMPGS
jgi:hypothetical protein